MYVVSYVNVQLDHKSLQKVYELRLAEEKAGAAIRKLPKLNERSGSRGALARAA